MSQFLILTLAWAILVLGACQAIFQCMWRFPRRTFGIILAVLGFVLVCASESEMAEANAEIADSKVQIETLSQTERLAARTVSEMNERFSATLREAVGQIQRARADLYQLSIEANDAMHVLYSDIDQLTAQIAVDRRTIGQEEQQIQSQGTIIASQAEQLQRDNAELAQAVSQIAQLQPRMLQPDEASNVATYVRGRPWLNLVIDTEASVDDAPSFAQSVGAIVTEATGRRPTWYSGGSFQCRGIVIEVNPSNQGDGAQLAQILGRLGVQYAVADTVPENTIDVFVGTKL